MLALPATQDWPWAIFIDQCLGKTSFSGGKSAINLGFGLMDLYLVWICVIFVFCRLKSQQEAEISAASRGRDAAVVGTLQISSNYLTL